MSTYTTGGASGGLAGAWFRNAPKLIRGNYRMDVALAEPTTYAALYNSGHQPKSFGKIPIGK